VIAHQKKFGGLFFLLSREISLQIFKNKLTKPKFKIEKNVLFNQNFKKPIAHFIPLIGVDVQKQRKMEFWRTR